MGRSLLVPIVAVMVLAAFASASKSNAQADPTTAQYIAQLQASEQAISQARARLDAMGAATQPAGLLDQTKLQYDLSAAEYTYRKAIRDQRAVVFKVAADPDLASHVMDGIPEGWGRSLSDGIIAVQNLRHLTGQTDPTNTRTPIHRGPALPVAVLKGYYQEAGRSYHLDWTYLAAINFIESDFGRTPGTSTAGAQGPMQFLPSTWDDYGNGDIMDSHDSILAAGRYLAHFAGGSGDLTKAVWYYNHNDSYVGAVTQYAAAIRRDQGWLDRYYYWYTDG